LGRLGFGRTSGELIHLILLQQSEDEADQLTCGEHESTAMFEAHRFLMFTVIESLIFRRIEPHPICPLDQIVAQIVIARLGHAAGFAFELAGFDAWLPQPRELRQGGLTLIRSAGLAFGIGHETLNILDFGEQTRGVHATNARN
jgi:hypothetical protein